MDQDSTLRRLAAELAVDLPDAENLRLRLEDADALHPMRLLRLKEIIGESIAADAVSPQQGSTLLGSVDALILSSPTLHRSVFAEEAPVSDATLLRSTSDCDAVTAADATVAKTQVIAERRVATLAAAPPARFEPGALIKGRFILKEKIGEGGMGVVFCAIDKRKTEARDPNPLVAIKVLNTEVARHTSAFIALQREARKAQALAHPNVATVFDFDRDGDTAFMCMELLRGRSLDQILHGFGERTMERAEILGIIRGMAEGLANAHRNGIVHSDLKPGNVFVTKEGVTKILDFGIARAIPQGISVGQSRDPLDSTLYAYTEAYATAEMVQGADPHPADDVYALSLIVYHLFAGRHPYQRYSVPKAMELGLKAAPLKGLRRHEWQTIQRGLSFDRAERPQSASEFLAKFFPAHRPQKMLIAAVIALGSIAVYVQYRSYEASAPAMPFEQLPAPLQEEFTASMRDGERLWQFYRRDGNFLALQEAVDEYANAYRLHPGNRKAVAALEKVADAALDAAEGAPEQREEIARSLAQRSDYLARYPPVAALRK